MTVLHVLQLVPEDGGIFLIVVAAHHDVPAPAERGHVAVHQRQAAAVAGRLDAAADDSARSRNRDQTEYQDHGYADGIKGRNPGEGC